MKPQRLERKIKQLIIDAHKTEDKVKSIQYLSEANALYGKTGCKNEKIGKLLKLAYDDFGIK